MGYRGVFFAVFLLCATWATAQVTVGDNLHMRMDGSAGVGYTGAYGNVPGSLHGLGFGFDGLLDGYYFDPRFVNFDVRPYFNRSQANGLSQLIARGTGVSASTNFFSNTFYPGSVTYGLDYTTNSNYEIAGVPSVVSDSSSQNVGVSWSLLLPNKPTLNATWGMSKGQGSITGTDMTSSGSNQQLTLSSNYTLRDWQLSGAFSHYNNNYTIPEFVTGIPLDISGSSSNFFVTAQHKIPLDGSLSLGWSHGKSESNGQNSSGSSYSVGVGITPWERLSLGSSFSYASSGSQLLADSTLGPSGSTINLWNNYNLMFLYNSAAVNIGHGFQLIGHMTWRRQDYGYATYTDTQYGGTVAWRYNKRWLQGFYFAVGAVNTANQAGNGGLGMNTTVGLDRRFGHWQVSADFNYLHDIQTLYNFGNTSYLNYGGNVSRKLNPQTYLNVFARSTHSGFVQQAGSGNMSNSFGGGLDWKGYTLSANYSAANGSAVLSGNGTLVATPNGPLFTPDYIYFDATAYSFSAGKNFRFRLSTSASYSRVHSSSQRTDFLNSTDGDRFGVNTTYNFRQLVFNGGFTSVNQQFHYEPSPGQIYKPQVINSFYVSVSRYFKAF